MKEDEGMKIGLNILLACTFLVVLSSIGNSAEVTVDLGGNIKNVTFTGMVKEVFFPFFDSPGLESYVGFTLADDWHPICGGRVAYFVRSTNIEHVKAAYAALLTAASTNRKVKFQVNVIQEGKCSEVHGLSVLSGIKDVL